jgi:hypothetical protein
VHVHEARGDEQASRVDLAMPAADIGPDGRDPFAVDSDVSDAARLPRTVDYCTPADNQIVHGDFLFL